MMYHLARNSCQEADFTLEPDIIENKSFSDPFTGFINKRGVISAGEAVTLENLSEIKALLI